MTIIIYLSLAVCLVGAVVYFKAVNPKWQELGRLSFGCGLLAFLLTVVPRLVAGLTGDSGRHILNFFVVSLLIMSLVGCGALSAWPTIIATGEAIAHITSAFYPAVGNLSADTVNLLTTIQAAATAYKANKTTSTEAAYVAAIQAIEAKLPADMQSLNIPQADQAKVTAAVSIILDYVEALAAQLPATSTMVADARRERAVSPVPQPMNRKTILTRWAQVCNGDAKCLALVR